MIAKGAFHLHSDFSYDCDVKLADLVRRAKELSYRFLIQTEHADDFDQDKLDRYRAACEGASGEGIYVLPGLEYRTDKNVHIVALGCKRFVEAKEIGALIAGIKEQGGVAILAHVTKYLKDIPWEAVSDLDGVEVWSYKYDYRLAPRNASIDAALKMRKKNPRLFFVFGVDMHSLGELGRVELSLPFDGNKIDEPVAIEALKAKKAKGSNGIVALGNRPPSPAQRAQFEALKAANVALRFGLAAGKKLLSKEKEEN